MRPIARSIREWWSLQPRTWRRGLVMSYPHYLHLHEQLRPGCVGLLQHRRLHPVLAACGRSDPSARVRHGSRGRRDRVCIAASRPGTARTCSGDGRANSPRSTRSTDVVSGRPSHSSVRPSHPPTLPTCPGLISATLARSRIASTGSSWTGSAGHFRRPRSSWSDGCRDPVGKPWWNDCERFLSRPNVHALGWRGQKALAAYYQAFDVTLIPYRMDHPFNRACNPTKIMDSMGSGRPIVATAIPECRLHAERFDVAENDDEFLAAIAKDPRPAVRRRPGWPAACVRTGEHMPRDWRANSRPDRSGLARSGPALSVPLVAGLVTDSPALATSGWRRTPRGGKFNRGPARRPRFGGQGDQIVLVNSHPRAPR